LIPEKLKKLKISYKKIAKTVDIGFFSATIMTVINRTVCVSHVGRGNRELAFGKNDEGKQRALCHDKRTNIPPKMQRTALARDHTLFIGDSEIPFE